MLLKVTIKEKDIKSYLKYQLFHRKKALSLLLGSAAAACLLCWVLALVLKLSGGDAAAKNFMGWGIGLLIGFGLMCGCVSSLIKRIVKNNEDLVDKCRRFTLDGEQITQFSDEGEEISAQKLNTVAQAIQWEELLLLYFTRGSCLILPLRDLENTKAVSTIQTAVGSRYLIKKKTKITKQETAGA